MTIAVENSWYYVFKSYGQWYILLYVSAHIKSILDLARRRMKDFNYKSVFVYKLIFGMNAINYGGSTFIR